MAQIIKEEGFNCLSQIKNKAEAREIYLELKTVDYWLAVEFWNQYEYYTVTGRIMEA